jgi:hypothetical protein
VNTFRIIFPLIVLRTRNVSDKSYRGNENKHFMFKRAGRSGDRILLRARYSAPVQTGPGSHPAFYTMGTGSFPGIKLPGRDVDHPPLPCAKVKKECNYTSTPNLGLRGLLYGELYLYLYFSLNSCLL